MKFVFSFRARIILIVFILAGIVAASIVHLLRQIDERDSLIGQVTENYQPSINLLNELEDKFQESRNIFYYLLLAQEANREIFRDEFNNLFREQMRGIGNSLMLMSEEWPEEDRSVLKETLNLLNDSLYFNLQDFSAEMQDLIPPGKVGREEINNMLAESEVIFILSEIEQNINFLRDKRTREVATVYNEISSRTKALKSLIVILALLSASFLILALIYVFSHFRKFINKISFNLNELATGKIPRKINSSGWKEFSLINSNFNKLFDYLRNLTLVARKIADRDFDMKFEVLSENDELGNSIINLQERLRKADQEEKKYKKEEEERAWRSDAIARINDILRVETRNPEDMGFKLTREICKITDSLAAGIFILENKEEEDVSIDLLAAYAYDREKHEKRSFRPGQGLIGRCVQEKESIYMTEIPESHISLRSGLGNANPVSLLIVPLKHKDNITGVLELASFRIFPPDRISVIEDLAENIATTLFNMKINIRTASLLKKTRRQAEELSAQEEELRQNMEEMQATQEQYEERERKLRKEIDDLKNSE